MQALDEVNPDDLVKVLNTGTYPQFNKYVDAWIDSGRSKKSENPDYEHPRKRWLSSDIPWALSFEPVLLWAENHRAKPALRDDGTLFYTWTKRDASWEEMFIKFLDHPDLRYRIAKCRYPSCGKYFLLRFVKHYKNGLHCNPPAKCANLHNAMRSDARKKREAKLAKNERLQALHRQWLDEHPVGAEKKTAERDFIYKRSRGKVTKTYVTQFLKSWRVQ